MNILPEPFDREAQDRTLVDALTNAEGTAVYLDTSALVWLYRIRERARAELVNFLDSDALKDRSFIPFWSLHELNKHRTSPKTLFPLTDHQARLGNVIEQIKSNAHLFVDDKFAAGTAWSTAGNYMKALTEACDALEKVSKPLNKPGGVAAIDKELAPFLEAHALRRPLPDLAPLREEFLARCEGRLPPGYEDRSKGNGSEDAGFSGANRFGDFVFWRSVVEHARSDTSVRTVVIISHDAKRDWVHLPEFYIGYGEQQVRNDRKGSARITCPQPALSFEIRLQADVERLFIVSIMQLVSAFSLTGGGSVFRELARAIQIEYAGSKAAEATESGTTEPANETPDEDLTEPESNAPAVTAAEGAGESSQAAPAPTPAIRARLDAMPAAALADRDYVGDPKGNPDADDVITSLKVRNWYTQNPAVLLVDGVVDDPRTSDSQLFVLGRNLYQAACGNAYRATDLLPGLARLNGPQRDDAVPLVFAGALYEAYFGAQGEIREHPKSDQLGALFRLAEREEFRTVVRWLHDHLQPAVDRFIILPGGLRREATFDIVIDAAGLPTGISVLGVGITEPAQPDEEYNWDSEALPPRGTQERITMALAKHFRLPDERVRLEPGMVGVLNFAHLRLRPWSTTADLHFPPDELPPPA